LFGTEHLQFWNKSIFLGRSLYLNLYLIFKKQLPKLQPRNRADAGPPERDHANHRNLPEAIPITTLGIHLALSLDQPFLFFAEKA
jgi:hypothetical protein